jgi:hypothetical protein
MEGIFIGYILPSIQRITLQTYFAIAILAVSPGDSIPIRLIKFL